MPATLNIKGDFLLFKAGNYRLCKGEIFLHRVVAPPQAQYIVPSVQKAGPGPRRTPQLQNQHGPDGIVGVYHFVGIAVKGVMGDPAGYFDMPVGKIGDGIGGIQPDAVFAKPLPQIKCRYCFGSRL